MISKTRQPRRPIMPALKTTYRTEHGVPVTAYHNALVDAVRGDRKPVMNVVMGNGAFATQRGVKHFVRHMIDAATQDGQAIRVMIYNDGWHRKAYTLAERARRFGSTVLDTADRYEEPIHLVGHSWSWPHAVRIARQFNRSDGVNIATLTAYTPANLASGMDERPLTPAALGREVAYAHKAVSGLGSVVTLSSVAGTMVGHFGLTPVTMLRGVHQAGRDDGSDERLMEVIGRDDAPLFGMLLAGVDRFYDPNDERVQQFSKVVSGQNGSMISQGTMQIMPNTTHTSAISDPRHGADLYRFIAAQRDRLMTQCAAPGHAV